jgi:hypothetical protein
VKRRKKALRIAANVSGYITAKPEKMEINEFINKHKIQEKILNSFSHLVNSNKIEDLNIEDKEISINIKKLTINKLNLINILFKLQS